ncbi:MAG: RagB/SusD family nutrient uptake outer membrane protein [Dysgonamonadaceae bacterium]|jgi:hypothetical protein|nr:RagB/SusD family nutrient uptake outer membrane protein [Dysgonamonadaceae bacterium]
MKKIAIYLFSFLLLSTSCIDTVPDEVLDHKDFYAGVEDADNGILGLYGQFMYLAGQVVVLNELRADLLDVTPNATTDLQEINLNAPSRNNPWASVSKFYSVIQTCNDLLYNFDVMLKENRMIRAEYNERYSDVAALRTWIYFQLGIHFGKIPYITQPIVTLADLDQYKGNELTLDELLPELIRCMENLPTLENYQASKLIQQDLDNYILTSFFVDKRCLLGDLYLFNAKGVADYDKAARIYRQVLAVNEDAEATNNQVKYRLYCYPWTSGTPTYFQILYRDGKIDDFESLYNGWRNMFAATSTGRYERDEWIWYIVYDSKFEPKYPFLELFNPVGYEGGKYFLKPSNYAVESIWGGETQKNGFPFDARGLTGAFQEYGGEHYVWKYSYFGGTTGAGIPVGDWFLYRAATLHLRYAEAANRAGYPKLAWSLVNNGISGSGAFVYKKENGENYPGDSINITGNSPFDFYEFPYYFDARENAQPYLRQPWRANGGVRGRANLPSVPFPETATTLQDSILFVEKLIISEAAKELGFEGNRWQDLIRVARRLNRETPNAGTRFLWDENIKKKYDRSGISGVDMSSEEKWFLPLYK